MGIDGRLSAQAHDIHYRIDGAPESGLPWLVFSNSLATDLTVWDDQVEAFSDRFRILRYDQRGHGQSGLGPGQTDFAALSADVLLLLDHLEVARFTFVGLSMGMPTGLALWSVAAGRIERFVFVDGQAQTAPGGAANWDARIELVRQGGMAAFADSALPRWFGSSFDRPGGLERMRAMMERTSVAGFVECATALKDYRYAEVFDTISVPVLMIAGADDGAMPQSMAALGARLAEARMVVIPQAGHIPNVSQPALFNEALRSFLA